MTQTQDEQNVQAAEVQAATPVTDDQAGQATAPDLSAVDLSGETPAAPVAETPEPVAEQPVETPVTAQPTEAPAQEQSVLQQ